jgi:hypothetical protein
MSNVINLTLLLVTLALVSCTGQEPAQLKSPQTFKQTIKSSCSDLVLDGNILTKNNLINIFNCSGWDKKYPHFNQSLISMSESDITTVMAPFNSTFLENKNQRNKLITVLTDSESRGQLQEVGKILEKSILDHKAIIPATRLVSDLKLSGEEKANLIRFFFKSKTKDEKDLEVLSRILSYFSKNKKELNKILEVTGTEKNQNRIVTVVDEITSQMGEKDWSDIAKIFIDEKNNSPLLNWSQASLNGQPEILINILIDPDFSKNLRKLNHTIEKGVTCKNKAHQFPFKVNVAGELEQVINTLKSEDKAELEKVLLHGLTKFLAFQEFCQEKREQQGLSAFQKVLNYAMSALESEADYEFIKDLHLIFEESSFRFLSFISTDSFEMLTTHLSDLDKNKLSVKFAEIIFQIVSQVEIRDLEFLGDFSRDLSEDYKSKTSWIKTFGVYWKSLKQDEKLQIIKLMTLLLDEEIHPEIALEFLNDLLKTFPVFTANFDLALGHENYLRSVQNILFSLDDKRSQKELSQLLSENGIFEVISVLTQNKKIKPLDSKKKEIVHPISKTLIERPDLRAASQTRLCFNELSAAYDNSSDYYQLVNELPISCRAVLGKAGFVGQIYLWMNQSQDEFKTNLGIIDFHTAQSVWSPGMLHFIFSAAVQANLNLRSASGASGIAPNIDEIHSFLTHPSMLEGIHHFSLVFESIHQVIDLDHHFKKYLDLKKDDGLKKNSRDLFQLLTPADPYLSLKELGQCSDLKTTLGVEPCQRELKREQQWLYLLRILKRKNEKGDSLIQELLNWLHPKGGIEITTDKNEYRKFQTNLDEVVRFLFDLSSHKTTKSFNYNKNGQSQRETGTTIDRLEVVIRDIGFLNNFYGAYFKNTVSQAHDYAQEIDQSKKLLTLMEKSGPVFRVSGVFPKETKDKLKNIRATYSSLAEVSEFYPQQEGHSQNYANFIQGLLSTIQKSSRLKTQNFNPYKFPDERIVDGHNGIFLTQVVEMSGLRQLANILRKANNNSIDFIRSSDFKLVNQHLIARHDLAEIKKVTQSILDKYLDSPRGELNLFIHDLIYLSARLNAKDQQKVLELLSKSLILLSSPDLENSQIQFLAGFFELLIAHWPEVRVHIYNMNFSSNLIIHMNQLLDRVLVSPKNLNSLVKDFSAFINLKELENVIKDQNFQSHFKELIESMLSINSIQTNLNWFETFKKILANDDVSFTPLLEWIDHSTLDNQSRQKLTLSVLIAFLGDKEHGQYRWKGMMDELFLNHRKELNDFIHKTFIFLNINSD